MKNLGASFMPVCHKRRRKSPAILAYRLQSQFADDAFGLLIGSKESNFPLSI
jgi:hypothetical protein